MGVQARSAAAPPPKPLGAPKRLEAEESIGRLRGDAHHKATALHAKAQALRQEMLAQRMGIGPTTAPRAQSL